MSTKSKCTYKTINDDYSEGIFLDTCVYIMNENGFINASKFCSEYGKELHRYFHTDRSKITMKGIEDYFSIEIDEQTVLVTKGTQKILLGKYVHPKLLVDIASWISIELQFKIAKIVDDYNVKCCNDIKEKELLKKNEKITEQKSEIKELKLMIQEMKRDAKEQYNNLKNDNNILKSDTKEIININKDMSRKINVIAKDRVIPTGDSKDVNHLILIRNNSNKKDAFQYTVLRVMKQSMNSAIKKHKLKFPKMKKVLDIDGNPSGMNLWKRIKTKLYDDKKIAINQTGMSFDLINPEDCDEEYTEDDLVDDFRQIHNKRLKTHNV